MEDQAKRLDEAIDGKDEAVADDLSSRLSYATLAEDEDLAMPEEGKGSMLQEKLPMSVDEVDRSTLGDDKEWDVLSGVSDD
jgi:hypothetical protein